MKIRLTLILCLLGTLFHTFTETTIDTTYYAVNGAIYTISIYDNYQIQKYEEYYSNSNKKYSVDYTYDNDTLRTEILKKANGNEFAYGEYSYSDLGYTYDYFHKSGKKLYTSDYSVYGYLLRQQKLQPNGKVYWRTEYTYDTLGWKTGEKYYGKGEELEAEAIWSYDSTTKITTYHYTLLGDSLLVNQYTGDVYDEYKTFYSSSLTMKDSTQVFYKGDLVYSSHFEWNENGYMTADKHFNSEGEQTSEGTYLFNDEDFTTTYRYHYKSDSTVWETRSDYRGVTEETNIFYGEKLTSTTAYTYNELLYTDSVLYLDQDKNLLAFGKYTYYEPYEWVKTYLYAYPNGDTITYVEYNEDGSISKIVATLAQKTITQKSVTVSQRGKSLTLTNLPGDKGAVTLFSPQGRLLFQKLWKDQSAVSLPTGDLAKGIYIASIQSGERLQNIRLRTD